MIEDLQNETKIYVIPTPIGNLSDITQRAIEVLSKCDILIVESFQETSQLLKKLNISNSPKLIPYIKNQDFNKYQVDSALESGGVIGVVSDAGMPAISDPGYIVIKYFIENNYSYTVLPGACSVDVAAAASGLIKKGYVFQGFVPTKKGRQLFWKECIAVGGLGLPVIILESVHRIEKAVDDMQKFYPSTTRVFIGRELTKMYEQYCHTTIGELSNLQLMQKGEFVVVIDSLK